MLKYALRNAIEYRRSYAAVFGLVALSAFLLSLALFTFAGMEAESAKYARAMGDIQIEALNSESSRLMREDIRAFFAANYPAERWQGMTYSPNGKGFNARGQWWFGAMVLDEIASFPSFALVEGEEPGEGEVLLPSTFREEIPLGESFTFAYKTTVQILDSRRLRVSGFYQRMPQFSNAMIVSRDQFASMHPGLVDPNVYFVYLAAYGGPGEKGVIPQAEFELLKSRLVDYCALSGTEVNVYDISLRRFRESREFIGLFKLISIVFIAILAVVAVMTIVNALFLTVLERIRIVATFMAFGMTKGAAILLIAAELAFFSAFACAAGLALSLAAARVLPLWTIDTEGWILGMLLGEKRHLTLIPSFRTVLAAFAVGTSIPFATAAIALRRLLGGQPARLLGFKK